MKFFVRASTGAPVKGPFERDSLRKSFDKGLMKPEAQVRPEDSEEWVTLKSLFKPEDDAKTRKAESAEFERSVALQNMERSHERSNGSANTAVGAIMLIAGLALTALSLSAGRGGGVIFVGLIVFGIIRIIRGLAAG